MEGITAQMIIDLLLQDEKLREQVMEAVQPAEIKRLYEQSRQIQQRVRELELRQAYLEQVVKELKARQEEIEERVRLAEAMIKAILQEGKKLPQDSALGFIIVRKPGSDTMLN